MATLAPAGRKESKLTVARTILARGPLRVHLDPRRPGVRVPDRLARGPALVLEVGWDMRVPIPDLAVDEAGVRGTLSFRGEPFHCDLPWSAVFGLADPSGAGHAWRDEVPPDMPASAPPPAPEKHELGCSFCERLAAEVAYLVAAERVSICDRCVAAAYETRTLWERLRRLVLNEADAAPLPRKPANPYRDASPTACSFCGEEHPKITFGAAARICRPCALLARAVLVERGHLPRAR